MECTSFTCVRHLWEGKGGKGCGVIHSLFVWFSLGIYDTLAVMSNGTFVEAVDTTAGGRVEKGPESSLTRGGVRWWRVCVS